MVHVVHVHLSHVLMVHVRHVHATRPVVFFRHAGHIHALHVFTGFHVAHSHVDHGAHRAWVHGGNGTGHAGLRGQRATGIAGAVLALGKNRIGLAVAWLDDHVIGFGHADAEFIHRHGFDIIAVSLDHQHFQTGYADIEKRHGRGVDEPQPHPLVGAEQAAPVHVGGMAIQQVGVDDARDIGNIGRGHAHARPLQPVLQRRADTARRTRLTRQGRQRALAENVVIILHLEVTDHVHGRHVGPFGQDDDIIPRACIRVRTAWVDDDGTVQPLRFLHAGMAVVPVGSALLDGKAVGEGLTGRDAGKAQPRHAIHIGGQADAMPVDGGVLVPQRVGDVQGHGIPLPPAQDGAGYIPPDTGSVQDLAVEFDTLAADTQVPCRTGCGRDHA